MGHDIAPVPQALCNMNYWYVASMYPMYVHCTQRMYESPFSMILPVCTRCYVQAVAAVVNVLCHGINSGRSTSTILLEILDDYIDQQKTFWVIFSSYAK